MSVQTPQRFQVMRPIPNLNGDGYWPAMAQLIMDKLIFPYVDVKFINVDISVPNRDKTDDAVMGEAIDLLVEHKVGVKGPTVTPDLKQTQQMGLKKKYASPNGLIRSGINGAAIFRAPIKVQGFDPPAPQMLDTVMARKATGDIYLAPEAVIPGKGELTIQFKDAATGEVKNIVQKATSGAGVCLTMIETDKSVREYAHTCFQYALDHKLPVVLSNKDTINPIYSGNTRRIFEEIYATDYEAAFKAKGIPNGFSYSLIDAGAYKLARGGMGGVLWALGCYDADVLSDVMGGGNSSLALMTSNLINADGVKMFDPPHGTAPGSQKLFEQTGTLMANPTAYIFAYADAIGHCGDLENNPGLIRFADALKAATTKAFDKGFLTKDLAGPGQKPVSAQDLVARIAGNLTLALRANPGPAPAAAPTV